MKWWFRNWRRYVRHRLARFVCLKIFRMQSFQIRQQLTLDISHTYDVYGFIAMTEIKVHLKAAGSIEGSEIEVNVKP